MVGREISLMRATALETEMRFIMRCSCKLNLQTDDFHMCSSVCECLVRFQLLFLLEVFWQSKGVLLIKTPSSCPPRLELGYSETQQQSSPVEQASREYRGLHLF